MRNQLRTSGRTNQAAGRRMFVTIHQMAAKWHKTWTRHFPSLSLQSARPTRWPNKLRLSQKTQPRLDFSQPRQPDAAPEAHTTWLCLGPEYLAQINCAHAQLFAHILNGPSCAQWSLVSRLQGQCTLEIQLKEWWLWMRCTGREVRVAWCGVRSGDTPCGRSRVVAGSGKTTALIRQEMRQQQQQQQPRRWRSWRLFVPQLVGFAASDVSVTHENDLTDQIAASISKIFFW